MTTAAAAEEYAIKASTSSERTVLKVRPPIEDAVVFELGMRAVNGPDIDPLKVDQAALDVANAKEEGVTIFEAPYAERVSEMFASRNLLESAMNGMGLAVEYVRGL